MRMHFPGLARVIGAAALLAAPAPATAQAEYGVSEWLTFIPSHTAVYTTTLPPQKQSQQQVVTTVVVTLYVPRDVGWPYSDTYHSSYSFSNNVAEAKGLVTGSAVSRFSAGATAWAETTQILWALAGGAGTGTSIANYAPVRARAEAEQAPPKAEVALTAKYTDTSHYSTEIYGWFGQSRYDYVSTYRVTVVEEVGSNYPATMVQTGFYSIDITVTGAPLRGGPETTYPVSATLLSRRTTTLVRVDARPTPALG